MSPNINRRDFMLVGTLSMLSLDDDLRPQQLQPHEEHEFQSVAYLVGPEDARPDIDDEFFDNKEFFAYIYEATDSNAKFYTDDEQNAWSGKAPHAPIADQNTDTVSNTTAETTITTYDIPGDKFRSNTVFKYNLMGKFSTASNNDTITLRFYLEDLRIATVSSTGLISDDAPWQATLTVTIVRLNGSGRLLAHVTSVWDGERADSFFEPTQIDLSTTETVEITAQWNNAKPGNSLTQGQGFVERWR